MTKETQALMNKELREGLEEFIGTKATPSTYSAMNNLVQTIAIKYQVKLELRLDGSQIIINDIPVFASLIS